jgi:hypothetical protein
MTLDLAASRGHDALVFDQLVAKSLVIPLNVVMLRIFAHSFAKVTLAQRNNLREALRLDGTNESLGVRVQIGTSHCCVQTHSALRASQLQRPESRMFVDVAALHMKPESADFLSLGLAELRFQGGFDLGVGELKAAFGRAARLAAATAQQFLAQFAERKFQRKRGCWENGGSVEAIGEGLGQFAIAYGIRGDNVDRAFEFLVVQDCADQADRIADLNPRNPLLAIP